MNFSKIICDISESFAKIKIKNKFSTVKGFTITCHTGALRTKMNSIDCIRRCIEWGAQVVEFDVSFRPDGTPVIIHNSSPAQNQGVLLEDALAEVAKSKTCKINLDIKSTKNLGAVDELVKQNKLEKRVFYTGVFEDWVDTVKENSSIPFFINYNPSLEESSDKEYVKKIIANSLNKGAIGINSNYRGVCEDMVKTVRKNGLLISLWTANKTPAMIKALELKPDNITTRNPHILKLLIK